MGCVSPGSLAAGGTNGDGQSGNATADPPTRTLVYLWPTGIPELFESDISGAAGATGAAGASITAFILSPESAVYATANFPQFSKNLGTNQVDYTLDYAAANTESAYWRSAIPPTATWNGATVGIFSRQAAQTTGTVGWLVTHGTRAAGDAFDVVGATDSVTATAVRGTAGQVLYQSRVLTTTAWATNSVLCVTITRDVDQDTVTEDAKFMSAVIEFT